MSSFSIVAFIIYVCVISTYVMRSNVVTAVLLQVSVMWDLMLCCWVSSYEQFTVKVKQSKKKCLPLKRGHFCPTVC
jgi:hypothetical protein